MRLVRAAAVFFVLLLSGSTYAATFGLRDIVAEAMQRNPDLQAAGAVVEVAEGRALEAEGVDDFILEAKASGQQTDLGDGRSRSLDFELDLTKPLPWGGSIGLRGASAHDELFDDTTLHQPSVAVVLEQPLLRGFGTTAARGQLKVARIERDTAKLSRAAVAATVLRDVASAYWELRFAYEVLELRKQLASSAREQLEIVNANIKAGKLPPSASAEVKVAAGLRDEEVLLAERSVLERSLELRTLAGMPIGPGETVVAADDSLEATGDDGTLADALERAAARNPGLVAARGNEQSAALEVQVTENGLLPQLDLSFAAGPAGSDKDLTPAFEEMGRFEGYAIQAALTFRHPIGRRAARGATLASRAALHSARVEQADIAAQTRAAVVRLHALTDEARRRLAVIAPTSEAAALDLSAEKARFEVGRASNFDVLRRQEELAQTQLRQARARTDLLLARASLWAATGEILERYGVTVR